VFGQVVTLMASVQPIPGVSGAPTGTVTFYEGSVILGTEPLTNGIATLPISTLSVGTNAVTASYNGDTEFSASENTVDVTVEKDFTSVAVTSNDNPSGADEEITFTAVVSPLAPGGGTPTGLVTFYEGGIHRAWDVSAHWTLGDAVGWRLARGNGCDHR
jgi:hypothetical protein